MQLGQLRQPLRACQDQRLTRGVPLARRQLVVVSNWNPLGGKGGGNSKDKEDAARRALEVGLGLATIWGDDRPCAPGSARAEPVCVCKRSNHWARRNSGQMPAKRRPLPSQPSHPSQQARMPPRTPCKTCSAGAAPSRQPAAGVAVAVTAVAGSSQGVMRSSRAARSPSRMSC